MNRVALGKRPPIGVFISANGIRTPVFKNRKEFIVALLCFIGMLIIGDIDYLTGYKTYVIVVYILPIGFATIDVGPVFAILLAVLSVVISICSDLWAGIPYSDLPIQVLNAAIALTVFVLAILLLQERKISCFGASDGKALALYDFHPPFGGV